MLKITRLADYAVLIICSFDSYKGKIVSSQEIINKTGLQKATVNKVLAILVRKNLLEAHRGVKGGYTPFKRLEDISVKELIEAVEGLVSLTDCIDNNGLCKEGSTHDVYLTYTVTQLSSLTLRELLRYCLIT